jgi:hypothetical protein
VHRRRVVVAGDARAELANTAADRVPRLGQPLRPEEQEGDHEDEQDFGETELKRHQRTRDQASIAAPAMDGPC